MEGTVIQQRQPFPTHDLDSGHGYVGQPPNRIANSRNSTQKSTSSRSGNPNPRTSNLSARDIMQGKTNPNSNAPPKDDYPGLDAILKKARKLKPFSDTDAEQRQRALDSMLPLGIFPRMREILHGRMEKEYIEAVAKWRADNWLLPVEKETEFPYARTRNLVDPMVKYGNLWLRRGYDSGFSYDSEGESIGFPTYMENIGRANAVEMIDLAIKGLPQWWKADESLLAKMKAENASLKKHFESTEFDRYEEVLKTYYRDGYTIDGRFRAFKLYSKEQQKLLEAYEAKPDAETKKALLQHVYKHGHLVRDVPKEDSYVKKPEEKKVVQKKAEVKVGSVMDSVDV